MRLDETLLMVWKAVLEDRSAEVVVGGQRSRVLPTRSKGLASVSFVMGGIRVDGIEQNPDTKSRWATLAREGKRIMQFTARGRYFANVCDGRLTRYPSWASLGLPE